MNRRQALERLGLLIGGAISAPGFAEVFVNTFTNSPAYVPQTLTAGRDETVATLVELIIPTTDTPGARAAGVHRFIDGVLTAIFTDEERARFLAGLADLEERAKAKGASSFVTSSPREQEHILRTMAAEAAGSKADQTLFFLTLKELTLVGYYNSEIGASQELKYLVVPGRYDGDVPLKDVDRTVIEFLS